MNKKKIGIIGLYMILGTIAGWLLASIIGIPGFVPNALIVVVGIILLILGFTAVFFPREVLDWYEEQYGKDSNH